VSSTHFNLKIVTNLSANGLSVGVSGSLIDLINLSEFFMKEKTGYFFK
jgi:hypothetical protein